MTDDDEQVDPTDAILDKIEYERRYVWIRLAAAIENVKFDVLKHLFDWRT